MHLYLKQKTFQYERVKLLINQSIDEILQDKKEMSFFLLRHVIKNYHMQFFRQEGFKPRLNNTQK